MLRRRKKAFAWLQAHKQARISPEIHEAYLSCFSSPAGKVVLDDLLNELDFWSASVKSDEEQVRQNFARLILYKIGAWTDNMTVELLNRWLQAVMQVEATDADRPGKSGS